MCILNLDVLVFRGTAGRYSERQRLPLHQCEIRRGRNFEQLNALQDLRYSRWRQERVRAVIAVMHQRCHCREAAARLSAPALIQRPLPTLQPTLHICQLDGSIPTENPFPCDPRI
jgi:hypothetical protein